MPLYLAFDFGLQRTGAAIGDDFTGRARALASFPGEDWKAVLDLVDQWRPAALIVGLPLDRDGSEQPMTAAARRFAAQLGERSGLPVHLADERYSSLAADELLREARASGRMTRRVRKGDRDAQAARVILQQWLESRG
ncbi:Holliday junction resolvase RuvX [Sinimarinibacterium flocculans]|mgnify:CR=1 FL=1|uniref:Putative pre-16S rRNA nuclease n=2 Tax=Sinimarinibacterium flocculans TaxID=985250 RepID=A0A318EAR7_9GAMM|nr:Holliday junction resolvase RuvX [Pseudomonadota bacterium]PXV66232.1 putative Holliday junction resolvase [Sinimarinibacterium flocculans]